VPVKKNCKKCFLPSALEAYNDPSLQLLTEKIIIGKNSFIGARAMIIPGVSIGDHAIVGAMSVVSKDVPDHQIVAGNPAKKIAEKPTN